MNHNDKAGMAPHASLRSGTLAPVRTLWLLAALWLLTLAAAPASQAQYFALAKGPYPLEFYDIDFSRLADPANRTRILDSLHYIPLSWGAGSYLSLGGGGGGGDWDQRNEADALRSPIDNSYDLQRVALDAYLHFDSHFSAFGEVLRADSFDKVSPSTTDETRGRLQQGFLQAEDTIGPLDLSARIGRQEITLGSSRFVWINDSSNVRTTQDGARVHAGFGDGDTLDLVGTGQVTRRYTPFDDWN